LGGSFLRWEGGKAKAGQGWEVPLQGKRRRRKGKEWMFHFVQHDSRKAGRRPKDRKAKNGFFAKLRMTKRIGIKNAAHW
jgi:hypothetical protein